MPRYVSMEVLHQFEHMNLYDIDNYYVLTVNELEGMEECRIS